MQQTKVGKFRYVSTKGHVSVSKQQTEIRRINHYPADGVVCLGHVYFVHPSTDAPVDVSTDISVDISTDTRPICRSTYRPIYRPRYVSQYVGRYVNRCLSDCRPTCRSLGYRHCADTSIPPVIQTSSIPPVIQTSVNFSIFNLHFLS